MPSPIAVIFHIFALMSNYADYKKFLSKERDKLYSKNKIFKIKQLDMLINMIYLLSICLFTGSFNNTVHTYISFRN